MFCGLFCKMSLAVCEVFVAFKFDHLFMQHIKHEEAYFIRILMKKKWVEKTNEKQPSFLPTLRCLDS